MSHEHHYQATILWSGADQEPTEDYRAYSREYLIRMKDKTDIIASADPAFLGNDGLHNPEDLLLASLSACHMLSYLALCARKKVSVIAYEDTAKGKMEMIDGVIRFSEVRLYPNVVISTDTNPERATRLHAQAHSECFIANSVNFPVHNFPTVQRSG